MNNNWKTHVAVVGLALVPVVAWSALAPAPFSTGPTPISSLPFTINDPGTYCLTGNLTAGAGVAGIDVQADNVVIDLGGFELSGGGDSDGSGIVSSSTNVTVRNGTISGWDQFGIDLADSCTVSDVRAVTTGLSAIRMGSLARVERTRTSSVSNSAKLVGTAGISVQGQSIVDRCQVVVTPSGDTPGQGIFAAESCTVVDCKVIGGSNGIAAGGSSQVLRCNVSSCRSTGIAAGFNAQVRDCIVSFPNQTGTDGDAGIRVASNSRVEGCQVRSSGGPGILFTGIGGRVERCDVQNSTGPGILVQGDVHLLGNRVFENGGAGIRVIGDRCVLLENVVDSNNDRGIVVDGRTSHLERNLASFNKGGDYDLEWGNPFGKIERPSGQMSSFESQTNYETPFGF